MLIAAITRMGSAAVLARYLHGPGRANEHTYAGRPSGAVIAGTAGPLGPGEGKGWAKDFHRTAAGAGSDRVRRSVWHCSLRTAPGDRVLSDQQWRGVAEEFVEAMGIEALPWVAVRHGADHVHLAVCRVADDGTVWKGAHDRRAAQAACTAIEAAHGLAAAPRQRARARRGPDSQLRPGEHAKAVRSGQVPQRVVLAEKVIAVVQATAGRGRAGFEAECARVGITAAANVASGTGRMSGYTFTDTAVPQDDRLVFKASQLHKCLAWNQLGPILTTPDASNQPAEAAYRTARSRLADYTQAWQTKKTTGRRPTRSPTAAAPRTRPPLVTGFGTDVDQAANAARAALATNPATRPQPATSPIPGRQAGGTNVHDRGL